MIKIPESLLRKYDHLLVKSVFRQRWSASVIIPAERQLNSPYARF